MKPVMQTTFGEEKGNCLSACIASILELPIEEVPNFCEEDREDWWRSCWTWLYSRGYVGIEVSIQPGVLSPVWHEYCILSGEGPRGCHHAVVGRAKGYQGFEYVHDPHPDGTFLKEVTEVMFITRRLG